MDADRESRAKSVCVRVGRYTIWQLGFSPRSSNSDPFKCTNGTLKRHAVQNCREIFNAFIVLTLKRCR